MRCRPSCCGPTSDYGDLDIIPSGVISKRLVLIQRTGLIGKMIFPPRRLSTGFEGRLQQRRLRRHPRKTPHQVGTEVTPLSPRANRTMPSTPTGTANAEPRMSRHLTV